MINIKETFNVVMLPTENYSPIVHSTSKYGGLFKSEYYSPMKEMGDKYQHLYITSNNKIQEGDWYYHPSLNLIGQAKVILKDNNPEWKKIVATTDESLKITKSRMTSQIGVDENYSVLLPKPPESFIQDYIKSYNEGDIIKKVDLKVLFDVYGYGTVLVEEIHELVLNQDNTFVIYEPKIYTESEVRDIVIDKIAEFSAHRDAVRKYTKSDVEGFVREVYYKATGRSTGSPDGFCDKWIKDNL